MNTSSEKNSSERTALLQTLKQRLGATASFLNVESYSSNPNGRAEVRFVGSQGQADMMETIVQVTMKVTPVERQQALEMLMALHAVNIADSVVPNKTDFVIDSMAKHAKQMIDLVEKRKR